MAASNEAQETEPRDCDLTNSVLNTSTVGEETWKRYNQLRSPFNWLPCSDTVAT